MNGSRTRNPDIRTVSHTLSTDLMETLRHFAFHERISESAVIEYALVQLFATSPPSTLATELKAWGATLRRRSSASNGGG